MYWRRKKVAYNILIPPITKNMDQLTKTEAQEYFEWFTGKLVERTEYLRSYTKLLLDYSPESLVSLWAWFLRKAEIEATPKAQLEALKKRLIEANSPFVDTILRDRTKQFTLETEYIIRDIGMYWGEIFVNNYPSIYWDYYTKPKRDLFVNRPLLRGFPNEIFPNKEGVAFEPIYMTQVQASRIFNGEESKSDLLRIHRIWESKIQ